MRRATGVLVLALIVAVGLSVAAPLAGAADPPQFFVDGAVPGTVQSTKNVSAAPPERSPAPPVDKVLIVSVPALDWTLVHEEQPPVLSQLLGRSAVASLSVRTVGPVTSLAESYATMGAGSRAVGGAEGVLVAPGQTAPPVVADLDQVLGANRDLQYGAEPGALGRALAQSGRRTAVVANGDILASNGERQFHREATLALMDAQGRVDAGTVGPELTIADPGAAGGMRADVDTTLDALSAAWSTSDVVLLEVSALARANLAAGPSGEAGRDLRGHALSRADALVGAALDQVDLDLDRDLVVVVAPVSGRAGRDGLTVAGVAGPGFDPGLATSASTNRRGYVTLTDVAPTVLTALGLGVPVSMTGASVTSDQGGPAGRSVFEELAVAAKVASFRDDATGPVSVAFVVLQLFTLGLAAAALVWWPRLIPVVGFLALVTLALPSLTFLSGLVRYDRLGVVGYVLALFVGGAVLAGAALALARASAARTGAARPLVAPLLLVGLTLAVLVGDILAGGSLQLNTVFGYSPIVAGRFTGYGNLAFALVAMAALVVVTGGWAVAALIQRSPTPRPRVAWLAAAAVVLAVVVVVDGHPALGTDVGGVLALVPAALVVVMLLAGTRVRLGHTLAMAAATVAVVAGFAAVDLARPPSERTHVGRFAAQVLDGGDGVAMVIERKIEANLSLLFSSVWSLVIPVALAFFVFLVRGRRGILGRLEADVPGLRACLVAALVLAVLGGALNDSGVAVPAMMLGVLLPYLTMLAVTLQQPSVAVEPVGERP